MIYIYLFWISAFIILYSYIGYPLLLFFVTLFKKNKNSENDDFLPKITILIAAYNESEIVKEKVQNTLSLNYPREKIRQVWVTDGSTDGTPEIIKEYSEIDVIHGKERLGKAAAINRAMATVDSPITVFSDANTFIHPNAILELVKPFNNPNVGCVAGEKKVLFTGNTSSSGESIYWKYESLVKRLESGTGSTLSAAGELFAIRTELYQNINPDTILDDFEISTQIALKGYSVKYSPHAVTSEKGSENLDEERKRKIRIAAGGFQTLFRNPLLLNPFKKPDLTFKYLSHKVLRWTIVPIGVLMFPVINLAILLGNPTNFYTTTFILLTIFYLFGLIGFLLKNNRYETHLFTIPYYLIMIHIAQLQGLIKYLSKTQNAKWEKVKRET